MNKALFIINPVSGVRNSLTIFNSIKQKFIQNKITFDTLVTEYKNHALEYLYTVDKSAYDSIFAIGGDGTYHEIINGILKRKDNYNPTLGFIPGGSGNSLMHDFNCLDPNEASDKILNLNVKKLDVMELQFADKKEYAFNILGWGMATDIGLLAEKIRWVGPSRYTVASLIEILKLNKRSATIIIDGKEYLNEYIFLLICNTIYTGNAMMAAPNARVDDGLLDVVILNKEISRIELLKLLPTLFKGEHLKSPYVDYKIAKKIELKPRNDEILNIDGEIKNYTPVKIKILKHKLSIYR